MSSRPITVRTLKDVHSLYPSIGVQVDRLQQAGACPWPWQIPRWWPRWAGPQSDDRSSFLSGRSPTVVSPDPCLAETRARSSKRQTFKLSDDGEHLKALSPVLNAVQNERVLRRGRD
jgi:hypothetical protein